LIDRLSPGELHDLTGLTQPAAQVRALRAMGIRAELRPDRSALVLREWLGQDCRQGEGMQEPELNL
jgi:hypothetical protein